MFSVDVYKCELLPQEPQEYSPSRLNTADVMYCNTVASVNNRGTHRARLVGTCGGQPRINVTTLSMGMSRMSRTAIFGIEYVSD